MPPLTYALRVPARFEMVDWTWAVLGTQVVPGVPDVVTFLVLRDGGRGMLEYRQSALRFVLKDGQDYEALICDMPNATRLFVNSLHGDIAVNANHTADTCTALQKDPHVSKLMFIPVEVNALPK